MRSYRYHRELQITQRPTDTVRSYMKRDIYCKVLHKELQIP